jgi:hypothetical protein
MKRAVLVLALFPMVAYAGAKASAFQKETKRGANFFSGAAAIDGKLETAWMVPGESTNRGEWIELDVPPGEVDKLQIVIGWAASDESFGDYARVKQARVDIFTLNEDQTPAQVGTATVTFEDKAGTQIVDLPDTKVGGELFGGKVRISVMDIYPGADYPNMAVSELAVMMKEFDSGVKFGDVGGEGAGHPKDHAVDEDVKTFWQLPIATPTFTLASNGYGVSSVGFLSAKDYSRPKTVEVTINGLKQTTVLPDKATEMVFAAVPAFNGYTGGAYGDIEVKIVDTYPGKNPDLAFTTIKAKATNASAF